MWWISVSLLFIVTSRAVHSWLCILHCSLLCFVSQFSFSLTFTVYTKAPYLHLPPIHDYDNSNDINSCALFLLPSLIFSRSFIALQLPLFILHSSFSSREFYFFALHYYLSSCAFLTVHSSLLVAVFCFLIFILRPSLSVHSKKVPFCVCECLRRCLLQCLRQRLRPSSVLSTDSGFDDALDDGFISNFVNALHRQRLSFVIASVSTHTSCSLIAFYFTRLIVCSPVVLDYAFSFLILVLFLVSCLFALRSSLFACYSEAEVFIMIFECV